MLNSIVSCVEYGGRTPVGPSRFIGDSVVVVVCPVDVETALDGVVVVVVEVEVDEEDCPPPLTQLPPSL